jgi:HrpA-like RNA helicase
MPVLLQKALDPPDPEFIEDALNLLVCMKALDRPSPRGRYEPTFYGRLLASFPLSFDASVLVLKFADFGLLQQGILLGILMDAQPQPILRPFGEEHLVLSYKLHVLACGNNSPSDIFFINLQYTEYAYRYYGGDCDYTVQIGRKEMILIGNLGAYQFWQHIFKVKLVASSHLLKNALSCRYFVYDFKHSAFF